jgi:hypothetical protein
MAKVKYLFLFIFFLVLVSPVWGQDSILVSLKVNNPRKVDSLLLQVAYEPFYETPAERPPVFSGWIYPKKDTLVKCQFKTLNMIQDYWYRTGYIDNRILKWSKPKKFGVKK